MPWTMEDVESKTKAADTLQKKRQWLAVANSVRDGCIKDGGDPKECDVKAITQANGVIKEGAVAAWVEGLDWDDRPLLEAHVAGLKSALESERGLRKIAERKLRDIMPDLVESVISGDLIPLVEKSIKPNGLMQVKVIQPGWGTTGYYSPEVLERDGPKVLKAGTKLFWDHPTPTEETERPEGSLRNMAGEFVSDAIWDPHHAMGPGLYGDVKVFSAYREPIEELGPHIGLSLRGLGRGSQGEADGRKGPVIKEVARVHSVDFVTMPGAGGKVLQLFEAARSGKSADYNLGGEEMSDELEKLKEAHKGLQETQKGLQDQLATEVKAKEQAEKDRDLAKAEGAKLKEALILREAVDLVGGILAKAEIPDITKTRLSGTLSKNPLVTKEGILDKDGMEKVVQEAIKGETEYLTTLMGKGTIKGMGPSGGDAGGDAEGKKKLKESYEAHFISTGISAEEAKKMADIAAEGR